MIRASCLSSQHVEPAEHPPRRPLRWGRRLLRRDAARVVGVVLRRDRGKKNRRKLRTIRSRAVGICGTTCGTVRGIISGIVRMIFVIDKVRIELALQKLRMPDNPAMEVEIGPELA